MLATEKLQRPVANTGACRPACPNCGRPMHLARITSQAGGLPDVRTYGCGECGVWATKAAGDDQAD
jgi:hypothetical protein